MIVSVFPGSLLLSQWIATKAIAGKTGTNHIPVTGSTANIELNSSVGKSTGASNQRSWVHAFLCSSDID